MTNIENQALSSKPLTYEQIWGEPETLGIGVMVEPVNNALCPYKDIQCPYWDQGCQAELCVCDGESK